DRVAGQVLFGRDHGETATVEPPQPGVKSADPDVVGSVLKDGTGVVAGQTFARRERNCASVRELIQPVLGPYPQAPFTIFAQGVNGALRQAIAGTKAFDFILIDAAESLL